MAKARCKCKATECEECPEWIFTFADLVMLMMGFFVILWVLKPAPGSDSTKTDQALPIEVQAAIREAFGYEPNPESKDPVDILLLLKQLERYKGPGKGGNTSVPRRGAEGTDSEVLSIRTTKHTLMGTRIIFPPNQIALDADSKRILDDIANLIRGHRTIVLVKGHTSADDFPEGTDSQRKMDLSLKRAQVAADYLVAAGVEAEILRVQGCSNFEPVAVGAYTPETRSWNRRVEVEATETLVEDLKDRPQSRPVTQQPSPTEAASHPTESH